jgi:hypothetical protein
MKKSKNKREMNYAIKLISSCLDGVITELDGQPVAPATIQEFAQTTPDVSISDDSGNAWPDIIFTGFASAPVLVISGLTLTAEAISGAHPPYRPK